ncbi:2-methoxy-6-polyprenyl-1,4-benzoquinol methylase, mitochondrial-like [Triticum aestivum]|uniref:2-methoxy-6-polyprenyl-1,4-benzoquinol methylase, mitochondrial-like n=1 Tax=Triticum aestivum TaxID=4565 RepID=UPI001D013934|nr:2-methoxy-6-polyprenyl-1,4-benzoquinol methylase, mitochondrial-like [Triticum aestivum]
MALRADATRLASSSLRRRHGHLLPAAATSFRFKQVREDEKSKLVGNREDVQARRGGRSSRGSGAARRAEQEKFRGGASGAGEVAKASNPTQVEAKEVRLSDLAPMMLDDTDVETMDIMVL